MTSNKKVFLKTFVVAFLIQTLFFAALMLSPPPNYPHPIAIWQQCARLLGMPCMIVYWPFWLLVAKLSRSFWGWSTFAETAIFGSILGVLCYSFLVSLWRAHSVRGKQP